MGSEMCIRDRCCNWIHEAAKELGNLDEEIVLQIQHLVASHHGKLEFGSPKKPSTPEAIAMHFIDNLDAKLTGFLELFNRAAPGPGDSRFGEHSMLLETRPYFAQQLDGHMGLEPRETVQHSARGGGSTAPQNNENCLLYTSPSPRDLSTSRMPSSA